MHSSRTRTARFSYHLGGFLPKGGVCLGGVCLGVSAQEGGCTHPLPIAC